MSQLAIGKLKHIDKGMTNIIQWDAVSGDLLRQMCAWQKQLKLAIHELEQERVAEPSNVDLRRSAGNAASQPKGTTDEK